MSRCIADKAPAYPNQYPQPNKQTNRKQIRRVLEAECGVALDPAGLYALSSSPSSEEAAAADNDDGMERQQERHLRLLLPHAKLAPDESEGEREGPSESEQEQKDAQRLAAAREALGGMAITPSLARLVRCV